jgi:hypothetical protein
MKKSIYAGAVIAGLFALGATAQGPRGHFGPGGGFGGGPFGGPHGPVVTGAPFSATLQTTTTQTLQDGNAINKSSTSKFARDAQGRTWTQHTVDRLGPWSTGTGPKTLIFITDPVAGFAYTLDPSSNTAVQRALHTPHGLNAEAVHEGEAKGPHGLNSANMQKTPLTTPEASLNLPAGLNPTGTLTTHTIPANTIGNAQPIVDTTESWYSSVLQTVIYRKHTDPRSGTQVFQMTNIQQGEPQASLFAVPSNYTIKTTPTKPALSVQP